MLPNVCFRVIENRLFIRPTENKCGISVGRTNDPRKGREKDAATADLPPVETRSGGRPVPVPWPNRIRHASDLQPTPFRLLSVSHPPSAGGDPLLQKPPFCKSVRHRTTSAKPAQPHVSRAVLRKILYGKAPNGYRIKSKVAQSPRCSANSGSTDNVRCRRSSLE